MIAHTNVKLNLGLRVLSRREDGFHEIETVFVPWDGMGDDIKIVSLSTENGLRTLSENYGPVALSLQTCGWAPPTHDCVGADGFRTESGDHSTIGKVHLVTNPPIDWPQDKDLCVRAYRLLDAEFGLPPVEIRLSKGTPTGAGLGGGSADAAWTLRMLRDMFALPLSDSDLALRAGRLGSDCPFFIYNRPMLGRGRGEQLEPLDIDLSDWEIRVAVPDDVSVNTAQAYRDIDARMVGTTAADTALQPLQEILALHPSQWRGLLHNDFEPSVFQSWPQIAALKEQMYAQGAIYAAMSGSGSAVFGIFRK